MDPHQNVIVERIVSVIDGLPPMPENVLEIRKTCSNPNASFRDLVPIIEKDPSLCADILHMANSAYFGFSHTVESISEAVRYIGFNGVADFVAVSFSRKAVHSNFSHIKNLDAYFAHSNAVARATRCLAKSGGRPIEIQEFYAVAGLLHDIGRLVILMVNDSAVRSFSDEMMSVYQDLPREEHELFGVDHCLVGKQICEKWQFSTELQAAILRHHSPISDPLCEAAAFIMLAHFVAMDDFPLQQVTAFYPPEINEQLGLNNETIIHARELYFGRSK